MFCTFLKNRYGFPSVVQLKIENDTGPSNTQTVESKFVTPAAHCRDARLMLRLSEKKRIHSSRHILVVDCDFWQSSSALASRNNSDSRVQRRKKIRHTLNSSMQITVGIVDDDNPVLHLSLETTLSP